MDLNNSINIKIKDRIFVDKQLVINKNNVIKLYNNLLRRSVNSFGQLYDLIMCYDELAGVLSEDLGWRYINFTRDISNDEYNESYNYYMTDILPELLRRGHDIESKIVKSPYLESLSLSYSDYRLFIKNIQTKVNLYRSANVDIISKVDIEAQQYNAIVGAMTVNINNSEMTVQQASNMLELQDRNVREGAYRKINDRRLLDKDKINDLYTSLINTRTDIAYNAGYTNYRDYRFVDLGRFEYSPRDCYAFHNAIAEHVSPLLEEVMDNRKKRLALTELRPWDNDVDISGLPPLKAFDGEEELLERSLEVLNRIDPFFGKCLSTMHKMNRLDLFSRKNKAPGGYNYPLDETGVPFIFMNATYTMYDLTTLFHECGHAVHAFLVNELDLNAFKHPTAEIAELASMSMEFFAFEHWDAIIKDKSSLNRSKKNFLEKVITTLPWVAVIDNFQHWVYTNPSHTVDEREDAWKDIFGFFFSYNTTSWDGLEHYRSIIWQKQLHLFTDPFYYIEYAIAQLGAINMWKQYIDNPNKTLDNYKKALSLGGTKTIKEVYETAGIEFRFDSKYIKELMGFVRNMWSAL